MPVSGNPFPHLSLYHSIGLSVKAAEVDARFRSRLRLFGKGKYPDFAAQLRDENPPLPPQTTCPSEIE